MYRLRWAIKWSTPSILNESFFFVTPWLRLYFDIEFVYEWDGMDFSFVFCCCCCCCQYRNRFYQLHHTVYEVDSVHFFMCHAYWLHNTASLLSLDRTGTLLAAIIMIISLNTVATLCIDFLLSSPSMSLLVVEAHCVHEQ